VAVHPGPDPVDIAVLAGLALTFLAGAARRGRPRPAALAGRAASFAAGLAAIAVATLTVVGSAARHSFADYAAQFCVLLFVAPALLLAGDPLGLWRPGRPAGARGRGRAPTWPIAVGPLLPVALMLAWFYTPWLGLTVRNWLALGVGHVVLLAVGTILAMPLVRGVGEQPATPYPALLLIAFLELLMDSVPGLFITLGHQQLAPAVWAGSAAGRRSAQRLGGEILWAVAEAIDIPFCAVMIFHWVRHEARETVRVDAELDAERAARQGAEPGRPADTAGRRAAAAPERDRPWWEVDPSVFGERAHQYRRPPTSRGS
jgi:putative membrane protein